MKNEVYPFLSATGADILTRLEQGPASAVMLLDEMILTSRGTASSALYRFVLQGLVVFAGFHHNSEYGSPPQQLYELTERGHAALEAHRAARSTFEARLTGTHARK